MGPRGLGKGKVRGPFFYLRSYFSPSILFFTCPLKVPLSRTLAPEDAPFIAFLLKFVSFRYCISFETAHSAFLFSVNCFHYIENKLLVTEARGKLSNNYNLHSICMTEIKICKFVVNYRELINSQLVFSERRKRDLKLVPFFFTFSSCILKEHLLRFSSTGR